MPSLQDSPARLLLAGGGVAVLDWREVNHLLPGEWLNGDAFKHWLVRLNNSDDSGKVYSHGNVTFFRTACPVHVVDHPKPLPCTPNHAPAPSWTLAGSSTNQDLTHIAAQPDPGWDYNPAYGHDAALNRVIDKRLSVCDKATFGKRRKGNPIQCTPSGHEFIESLRPVDNGGMPNPEEIRRRSQEAYERAGGAMPEPRRLDIELLPTGKDDKFYLERFMARFGAEWDETKIIQDVTGAYDLAISGLMFEDHLTGKSKTEKRGRAPYLLYVAETVIDPDEVWLTKNDYGHRMINLLSSFVIKREAFSVISVFKETGRVWTGWTGYQSASKVYIHGKRSDDLIYRRK